MRLILIPRAELREGRSRRTRTLLAAILFVALGAAACSDGASGETPVDGLRVIATTSILGDLVSAVVGDLGTVEVLLPIGADPHDYQASSQQVAALQRADLVLANGLGLEEGLHEVLEAAAADGANVVEIAPQLDPLPFAIEPDKDHDEDLDPHVWMDPVRMAEAAALVAGELTSIDPDADWSAGADAYAAALLQAHEETERILAVLPAERRKLVTNHAAFGYFATRYGFEVVGVIIPGGSTMAEPSSAELAALVAELRTHQIGAIFTETTESSQLAETAAAEAGMSVVELFAGSLGGPGSGAETLPEMLVTNAERIAAALG